MHTKQEEELELLQWNRPKIWRQ